MPEPTPYHDESTDFSRLLEMACKTGDVSTARGRGMVAAQMAAVIARLENPVQRERFILEVVTRLKVSQAVMTEAVSKAMADLNC
jgi:hypothetical protein